MSTDDIINRTRLMENEIKVTQATELVLNKAQCHSVALAF